MRTVLTAEDIAFEQGFQAYTQGARKTDNHHPFGSKERSAWFAGWDRAQACGGTCNG